MLHAYYLVRSEDVKAECVKNFIAVFKLFEHEVFGGAIYQIQQKRNKDTREPGNLPKEETVQLHEKNN